MTCGVLIYCFDTPEVKYSTIAAKCLALIDKNLKLPTTVITDTNTAALMPVGDHDIRVIDIERNNTKLSKPWYNLERHLAYEHSPYDKTVVMDVDYFCYTNKLRQLVDSDYDFLVHQRAHDVTGRNTMNYDRNSMLDLVWATVLIFKKTKKAKQIFDTVKIVKQNYSHFCNLYRISYRNFRNDYAFSIALNQINGHRNYPVIPDSMATVPADVELISCEDNGLTIGCNDGAIKLHSQDLHILNKELANV